MEVGREFEKGVEVGRILQYLKRQSGRWKKV